MKNFSNRLKKTAPLVLLGLILDHTPVNQTAQALVGGPFDDNSYPGANADGTYSGTVSGHNLIGVVSFGVSSSQETSGRFSIFHEGFVHYGAATGIADLASRRVAGSLLGVANLGGSGTGGGGVNVTDTNGGASGGTSPGTAASTGTLTVRDGVEGSFNAQMKGYPQQIKFEGDGVLSSNANTAVVTRPTLSPTTGVIDALSVFLPTNTGAQTQSDSPSENSNSDAAGGVTTVDAEAQRSILRTMTPFKIRGSRTSRTVYTVINNYTAITTTTVTATPAPTASTATPAPTPVPP